jgi:hypothetical protein
MAAPLRRRLVFLAGFTVYFAVIWFAWETILVYPLKVFVVFLHEASHAAAAVATGGSIQAITLDPRLGGACLCPGGNAFLTLSAGYLGSLVWGAAILEASRLDGIAVHRVLKAMALGLGVLTLLYVRGWFGFSFGIAFGLGLFLAARHLSTGANQAVLTVLGLTSCLYAVLDIKSDILDRPELRSDAYMLAELTGIPTVAWGVLWISAALAVSAALLVRAYRAA